MNRAKHSQGGFSLVELMIGVALGLVVMAALTSFFVQSSQNRREIDRAGQQIENGRYAMSTLRNELHLTGFFAEMSFAGVSWQTPDPCVATGTFGFLSSQLAPQIPVPIFGYADGATMPACVTDRMAGTDVLVIHRFNTEMTPLASVTNNGAPFLQISRCASDSTSIPWTIESGVNVSQFSTSPPGVHNTNCSAFNDLYRYRSEIFYIRTWSVTNGDGIPTLVKIDLDWDKCATTASLGCSATGLNILPLVEGIENMRIQYGVDNDGDGAPDEYRRCDTTTPCTATQWAAVTAARVNLLARNLETTTGYTDTKTYDMGSGSPSTVGPFNDSTKRHVYAAMITLPNRAGPRE